MNAKFLYFLGGFLGGSAGTYFFMRKRMEAQIAQEVEDVKSSYEERKMRQNASESLSEAPEDKGSIHEENSEVDARKIAEENARRKAELILNSNIMTKNGYVKKGEPVAYNLFSKPPKPIDIHNGEDEGEDLTVDSEIVDTTPDDKAKGPYTITPVQFVNEEPYFDKITLEYFDDDILCNELTNEIITDVDGMVGRDSLTKFGEFEEDVVYVRNERISTDYEIIRQYRTFARIPGYDY